MSNRLITRSLSVLVLFMLCTISLECFSQKRSTFTMKGSPPWRPIKTLKKLVKEKGDIDAYDELSLAELPEGEFFLYALYMANKYNYPLAYYDVYYSLVEFCGEKNVDENTLNLALYYLKKGAELEDWNCMRELSLLYLTGKYVPLDSVKGKELRKKIDSKRKKNTNDN